MAGKEKKGLSPVLNEKGEALSRVDLDKILVGHASDSDWQHALQTLTYGMDRNSTKYLDTLALLGDYLVSDEYLEISYKHFRKISDIYDKIECIPNYNSLPNLDRQIEDVFDRQFIYFLNKYVQSEVRIPEIDGAINNNYYQRFKANTQDTRRAIKLVETGIVTDPEARIQLGKAPSNCLRYQRILDGAWVHKDEIDVIVENIFNICSAPSTYPYGEVLGQYTKRYYELKLKATIAKEVFKDGLFDDCSPIIEKAILYGDIPEKCIKTIKTLTSKLPKNH